MRVEEEFIDVLQNLEFAIVQQYRQNPKIVDLDVRDALDSLIRVYNAEAECRGFNPRPLGDLAESVKQAVREACAWRLGRSTDAPEQPDEPLSLENLVLCLKRVRSSVEFWTKRDGTRGYLSFVNEHIV